MSCTHMSWSSLPPPTVPRVSQEHCPGCPQWAHAAQMTGEELRGHAAARSLQTAPLTHRPTRCCLKHAPVWSGLSRLLQLGHADSPLGCRSRLPGCLHAASTEQVCGASPPVGENSDGDRCGEKGGERVNSGGVGPGGTPSASRLTLHGVEETGRCGLSPCSG